MIAVCNAQSGLTIAKWLYHIHSTTLPSIPWPTYVHMYIITGLNCCMVWLCYCILQLFSMVCLRTYPGRSVSLDVCSVTSNGQLMMFSGCLLNYGMHNISLLPKPEDLSWLDSKISSLGNKFTKKYVRCVCVCVCECVHARECIV